jgi:superfamily I DNA/RNA helicase
LENIPVDDLDGGEDSSSGYRSLMHGQVPMISRYHSAADEVSAVASRINELIDAGEALQDICITARTRRIRDEFSAQLEVKGLKTLVLEQQNDNRNLSGIRMGTMHRVKGLEFKYVFIVCANDGLIPLKAATSGTEDPVEARQRDLNERALFHVAATRAIRGLFISSSGNMSPYLDSGLSITNTP